VSGDRLLLWRRGTRATACRWSVGCGTRRTSLRTCGGGALPQRWSAPH
jgi:hypothetical protein